MFDPPFSIAFSRPCHLSNPAIKPLSNFPSTKIPLNSITPQNIHPYLTLPSSLSSASSTFSHGTRKVCSLVLRHSLLLSSTSIISILNTLSVHSRIALVYQALDIESHASFDKYADISQLNSYDFLILYPTELPP